MDYAKNVTDLIGATPLIRLNKGSDKTGTTLLAKCEFLNPGGSIKDRIGANMIKRAFEDGLLTKENTIIEGTSGNTGIGLAMVAAGLGLKLILTMPSSMSVERRRLLSALGAELVLTDPAKGMTGANDKAQELAAELEGALVLHQFENPANPQIHVQTTGEEIWKDTDGKIDIFVAAIGTGGTITGVSQTLKRHNPEVQIIAVEPEDSAILSGGKAGAHKIQGIGAGFVPKVLNTQAYDEVLLVSNEQAFARSRALASEEGLLVGISAGANVFVAEQVAARPENKGKVIVTILPDTGERYLSAGLYGGES